MSSIKFEELKSYEARLLYLKTMRNKTYAYIAKQYNFEDPMEVKEIILQCIEYIERIATNERDS